MFLLAASNIFGAAGEAVANNPWETFGVSAIVWAILRALYAVFRDRLPDWLKAAAAYLPYFPGKDSIVQTLSDQAIKLADDLINKYQVPKEQAGHIAADWLHRQSTTQADEAYAAVAEKCGVKCSVLKGAAVDRPVAAAGA